jgi:hypothetical protein
MKKLTRAGALLALGLSVGAPKVSSAAEEIWQRKFSSHAECVQARIDAKFRPDWAERLCTETRDGNNVPPDYYTLGACNKRMEDLKYRGVIKFTGMLDLPKYCSNSDGEKKAVIDMKLR